MIAARKATLLVSHGEDYFAIAKIQWVREKEGVGVFVHLPYHSVNAGILVEGHHAGPAGSPSRIEFCKHGLTTTHHVKYAHHSDGNAHFSQDGRIKTEIKSKTRPLSEYTGHLFSINYWSLAGFRSASGKQLPALDVKESNIAVGWSHKRGEVRVPRRCAGRIVGHLFHGVVELPTPQLDAHQVVMPVDWALGSGNMKGTILVPPSEFGSDLVLGIHMESSERYKGSQPKLVFLGGFDDDLPATIPESSVRYIALQYGMTDFKELRKTLPTVDLE
jgi:hypothetical protein